MKSIIFIFLMLQLLITDSMGSTFEMKDDTLIIEYDSLKVKDQIFLFENHHLDNYDKLILTKNKSKRVLLEKGVINEMKFLDMNNDTFKDVLLCTFLKNTLYCHLFVYDQTKQNFIEVKEFFNLPNPQKIPNTKYLQTSFTHFEHTGHIDQQKLYVINKNRIKLLYTISDYVYEEQKKNKTILEYCGKKIKLNIDLFYESSRKFNEPYDEEKAIQAQVRFWQKILKRYTRC